MIYGNDWIEVKLKRLIRIPQSLPIFNKMSFAFDTPYFMSSLKFNEKLQCNIFTFEPSVVLRLILLKCIVNLLDQCLTFSCQLKTMKGGNKNHLLFSPRSNVMNGKLIFELEQVMQQVKASKMKLCRYIATKEQCSLNFDKRFLFSELLHA